MISMLSRSLHPTRMKVFSVIQRNFCSINGINGINGKAKSYRDDIPADLPEFLRAPCTSGLSVSNGCSNNCNYCFVKHKAETEYGFNNKTNDWRIMKSIKLKNVLQKANEMKNEIVQFPTTHDITPNNLSECISAITALLKNNHVVVVTKPFEICIDRMMQLFADKKDKITFRLSITANDNDILNKWEPGAPKYEERMHCLQKLYTDGWKVGASICPMLDLSNVVEMYYELEKYCNDTMYVAMMNQGDKLKPTFKLKQHDIEKLRVQCGDLKLLQQIHGELKKSKLFASKVCVREEYYWPVVGHGNMNETEYYEAIAVLGWIEKVPKSVIIK